MDWLFWRMLLIRILRFRLLHTLSSWVIKMQHKPPKILSLWLVIEVNKSIINTCIELRKEHHIKLPDAIIAATALVYELTIITNNEKDFANINGLKFVNPHKI